MLEMWQKIKTTDCKKMKKNTVKSFLVLQQQDDNRNTHITHAFFSLMEGNCCNNYGENLWSMNSLQSRKENGNNSKGKTVTKTEEENIAAIYYLSPFSFTNLCHFLFPFSSLNSHGLNRLT
jgi:hypothetical protein